MGGPQWSAHAFTTSGNLGHRHGNETRRSIEICVGRRLISSVMRSMWPNSKTGKDYSVPMNADVRDLMGHSDPQNHPPLHSRHRPC